LAKIAVILRCGWGRRDRSHENIGLNATIERRETAEVFGEHMPTFED
jgi:hypothetical protein